MHLSYLLLGLAGAFKHLLFEMAAQQVLLVVVHNLDVEGVASTPSKTDPPLIIDADAVLASPIPPEFLEPVTRRDSEITDLACRVALQEEAPGLHLAALQRRFNPLHALGRSVALP